MIKKKRRLSAEIIIRDISKKLKITNYRMPRVIASRLSQYSFDDLKVTYKPARGLAFHTFWCGLVEAEDKLDVFVCRPDGLGLIVEIRGIQIVKDSTYVTSKKNSR